MSELIRATRIRVMRGRMRCELLVGSGAPRDTNSELMRRVLAAFPTLPDHACVNELGDTFGAVMDDTPLPHLIEHLVIDLQVRSALDGRGGVAEQVVPGSRAADRGGVPSSRGGVAASREGAGSPRSGRGAAPNSVYVGMSEWVDEDAGAALVEVSFTDDLVALAAFRDAIRFVNSILQPVPASLLR